MIRLDESYPVVTLLALVAARRDREVPYDLYWQSVDGRDPTPADTFLLAAPAGVRDGELVFPACVEQAGWWLYCSDRSVQDVVDRAVRQRPTAIPDDLLRCLVHYMHEDSFLELV